MGVISLGGTYLWELKADFSLLSNSSRDPLYVCAVQFKPALKGDGLLVASGEVCRRPNGEPAAGNKPYMFYWLERKGFNLCEDEQSIERLSALAARGATFFVGEKDALKTTRGFEAALRNAFPVVAECDAAILFRLTPASVGAPSGRSPGGPTQASAGKAGAQLGTLQNRQSFVVA